MITPLQELDYHIRDYLTVFPAAAFFGSLLAYIPTELWGRRRTLIANCLISVSGNCMVTSTQAALGLLLRTHSAYSVWIPIFAVGRGLSGVATGVSSFLVPLYSKS